MLRKIVFLVSLLLLGFLIFFVKIAFFNEPPFDVPKKRLVPNRIDVFQDAPKIIEENQTAFYEITNIVDALKEQFTESGFSIFFDEQKRSVFIKQVITIAEEKRKRQEELINTLRDISPEGWEFAVVELNENVQGLIAKVQYVNQTECQLCEEHWNNPSGCQQPIKVFSRVSYEIYESSAEDDLLLEIQNERQSEIPGFCRKEIFIKSDNFVFVDTCVNDFRCSNIEELERVIRDSFQ